MKIVYKYPLKDTNDQTIQLPALAEVLSVGVQDETIMLWALVDTVQKPVPRRFIVRGTGHPMDPNLAKKFIGTVSLGSLVFHVFEA